MRDPRNGPDSIPELLGTLGGLVDEAREQLRRQQARAELALALQRRMLPPELPVLPGLRLAARYLASQDGLDVGGDWYDAFAMEGGTVGIAIGDVQGHDVEAAASMGQLRIGLRAVAATVTDPGEVLALANDLLLSMSGDLFATCCFLRFDPRTGALDLARAGHVPMVWATDAGAWGTVQEGGGPPLGVLPGERYPVSRQRVTAPGALVLVTDGVVDGPSCPLSRGLAEVARLVRLGCDADADDLAAAVIKVSDLTGHNDDAAVLVCRYDGLPAGP